jgi:hypothetical protein
MMWIGIIIEVVVIVTTTYWHKQMEKHHLWWLATIIACFGTMLIRTPNWIGLIMPLVVPIYCLIKIGRKKTTWIAVLIIAILLISLCKPSDPLLVTLKGPGENDGVSGPSFTKLGRTHPGWHFEFKGPEDAQVQFPGREREPINSSWGIQEGTPMFFGPKGAKVKIVLTPP